MSCLDLHQVHKSIFALTMKPLNAMADLYEAVLNISWTDCQIDSLTETIALHAYTHRVIWSTDVRQVLHGSQSKSILTLYSAFFSDHMTALS